MTRNKTALIAVVAAVGALLWYAALFAPARSERRALAEQVTAAERKEEELHATRVRLRALEPGREAQQARLERLQRLVPPQADMAGFLLAANDAAVRSGVDWVSVAPAAAVAGVGGQPSTIAVSVAVNGGFFTIVEYLRLLEDLGRLVVVDSLQLAPGGQATGPLQLSATISARIFTSAAVAPPPGAPAPVAPPGTPAQATTSPNPAALNPAVDGAEGG